MKLGIKLSPELKKRLIPPATIVALGLLWAGYELYVFHEESQKRFDTELAVAKTKISRKKTELKNLQDFVSNIESIKTELRQLNAQLDTALEHMPPTFDLAGLLRQFSLLAQNSGLEIANFKPEAGEKRQPSSFYSSTSIAMDLSGTFTQTLTFLDQLSRLKRIVNVEKIKIKGSPVKQKSGSVKTSTQAVVRTYRFAE